MELEESRFAASSYASNYLDTLRLIAHNHSATCVATVTHQIARDAIRAHDTLVGLKRHITGAISSELANGVIDEIEYQRIENEARFLVERTTEQIYERALDTRRAA